MAETPGTWTARTEGVVWRSVGEEVILMDLGPSVYHAIRGVGADVWTLLATDARTVDELVEQVLEAYDADEARVRRDVISFLQTLRDAGLADTA